MGKVYTHIKSFCTRLRTLAPLMGGYTPAALYLIRAKGKPMAQGLGTFLSHDFIFRSCDITALQEVLIDQEYVFLTPYLQSLTAPVVVDLGAHIGTFSLWLKSIAPDARMTIVEASPDTYDILQRNTTGQLINRAAWRNNETIKLSCHGDSMGHKISDDGTADVQGITFPEVVNLASDAVDLMKIDIEGAEEAFFENADLTHIKRLVIELHPKRCDTKHIQDMLTQRYDIVEHIAGRIDDKPLLYCYDT